MWQLRQEGCGAIVVFDSGSVRSKTRACGVNGKMIYDDIKA